ncbi:MAG TPA: dolichyl-phosphate beta-glucosyltransferase [Candidatus Saccharimonadia bacterium]|nr:dolichyl-phosphate beta-glucosyltransferase [Candidatus Saccharimonadia bacterium]
MPNNVYLSVVIPSFNESSNLAHGVLNHILEYLSKQTYVWELILSDDGSTDDTLKKLEEFAKGHPSVKVLHNQHQGKGPTVLAGMQAATGKLRLFTDFDQATPIEEVEKLLPFFDDGFDVVIGSREGQGASRDREPFHRHIMGRVFNAAVRLLTIPEIRDTQCGFKMFTGNAVHVLFPKLAIYRPGAVRKDSYTGAFDVELLYIARKLKMKIAEVPVHWHYMETQRVDPIRDSALMFIDLLRIRMADLQGAYRK